jgi:hypothetical protein
MRETSDRTVEIKGMNGFRRLASAALTAILIVFSAARSVNQRGEYFQQIGSEKPMAWDPVWRESTCQKDNFSC